jgi:hypothetical protein
MKEVKEVRKVRKGNGSGRRRGKEIEGLKNNKGGKSRRQGKGNARDCRRNDDRNRSINK